MRRHGVPYAARLQFGQTHLELAGTFLEDVVHDELVDDTVVALLQLAGSHAVCLERALASVDGNPLRLVLLVCRGGVQVELGRIGSILALEGHLLVSAAHVESLLEFQFIFLPVNRHDAVSTDVDDAQFTVVEEVGSLQRVDGVQRKFFGGRYGTAEDEAVVHGVSHVNLVGDHNFFHREGAAQTLRVVVLHVLRVAGSLDGVVHLGRGAQCSHAHHDGKCQSFHSHIIMCFFTCSCFRML